MKFLRLRLTNIGAFYGNYDFDLVTAGNNLNVILVGGRNGAGKTTILESIRIALFGPLMYGLKTESDAYFEKIDARLNNKAKSNGEEIFRVILDIEQTESLRSNQYTLKRSWRRSKSGLREEFSIQQNNSLLNERDTEIFQEKLRQENPPKLLELCLFDGEQISHVITNNSFPEYLRAAARVLFNLDLFESLEVDLRNIVKQDGISQSLSQDEQLLQDYTDKEALASEKLENLRLRMADVSVEIAEQRALLSSLNKEFALHGGLKKEQRDKLMREIHEVDNERLLMMDRTKNFITNLLPFILTKDVLGKAVIQMQNEADYEQLEKVKKVISVKRLEESLSLLENEKLLQFLHSSEVIAKRLYSLLITSTDSHVALIHHASFQHRSEIESLKVKVQTVDVKEIINNFKKNSEMIKLVQNLRVKLDENDSSSDLRSILDHIHEIQQRVQSFELTREQLLVNDETMNENLSQLQLKIEQLRKRVISSKKAHNVFSIIKRVTAISEDFRRMQTKKKLQQVEVTVASMLNEIFRKELFITRVSINAESFEMNLYNDSNEVVNKERLSAGERHILLLSTIWAMVSCSGRTMPFVFDTLLGRLDQKHKQKIISHFIPRCGEQVIILSTDSEIDAEHFIDIKQRVSKAYTIEHNVKNSKIDVIENSYFDFFNDMEVSV